MEKKETPQARWDRRNSFFVGVKFMRSTEKELIEKLESVPNRSGYIKELIRADLESRRV